MATVKAHGGTVRGTFPQFTEQTWTVIAADHMDDDGNTVIDHDEVGTCRLERRGEFAFKVEAEAWIAEQLAEGFELDSGPCPLATFRYHGPTDSDSNAWSARVSKAVQ